MNAARSVDLAVLVGYLAVTVGFGAWFALRKRNTDDFMAGGRDLPGWAVGLSMFGAYVSSLSFLGNPGKSFGGNWNAFCLALTTPIAAAIAVRWFVPFYRRTGEVSAYEHLERRFGPWARTYAVACFLLLQVGRIGGITYPLAVAVAEFTGWGSAAVPAIIILIGAVMIVYSVFGGIEAVVWIGVFQSLVLILGPVFCLVVLLRLLPGGAEEVVRTGATAGKFSLGGLGPVLTEPTLWVTLAYGLAINLTNFGVDQGYIQRYVTTPTEREAKSSVWITTGLFVPVSAFFFFLGTALFALSLARPEVFSGVDLARRPDEAFPRFIATQLPIGLGGLVVASIFAASLDSNLTSMATLTLCDVYKRYFRTQAGERESMWVLRGSTVAWGVAGTAAALALIKVKNVLDAWWEIAGVCSGGMLGLFLLGLLSRRAGSRAAAIGVLAGIPVIAWMTLSTKPWWPESLAAYRSPFHTHLVIVFGTATILGVGLLASLFLPDRSALREGEAPAEPH